ncbi:MAG: biotin/lipoyl-containing protein [Pelagibacteraceae bacterium]|jgi:pyruvate/2-oxoglutarate dehydrogenase complex dihydrolipoamide acyltransferase (E2) component|nr:hypothetical protein [Candidatus Pelagibacter sp.]MDP6710732.1 biotin/lipoyl-containing protein [Pelagibacteraceae bacterium]|tara:strand:+ start:25 stop:582 length:558 start_codon:yes stop_codon:yes gene_type:complete
MITQIIVPDIGDFKDFEIIEILVKSGDVVKKNDSIVTLESDKSSMEIPSPFTGKISTLKVKLGDKVSKGSILALIVSREKIKKESIKQKNEKAKLTAKKEILPETEKIIKEAESAITQELIKKPVIQEYEISDILGAVDSISKIEKKKNKIVEKKGSVDKDDVLTLNNQVKTKKSEILVLNRTIE